MSAGGTPGASGAVSTGGTTSGGGTATGGCKELADIAVCIDGSTGSTSRAQRGGLRTEAMTRRERIPTARRSACSGGDRQRKQHPAHVVERRRNWATLLDVHTAAARSDRRWDPFADSRAGTRWLSVTANPASENGYEGVIFIDDSAISGAAVYDFEISWCIGTGAVTGAGGATGASGTGGATGSIGSHCTNVCPMA